ncbi:MAG: hypothetical protein M1511_02955 [Deltaproteobacteria bacterium]|nr:hypothetical protein [Deltaproteobacteria bacterium]
MELTAILKHEGSGCGSLCPELDIANRGDSIAPRVLSGPKVCEILIENGFVKIQIMTGT